MGRKPILGISIFKDKSTKYKKRMESSPFRHYGNGNMELTRTVKAM